MADPSLALQALASGLVQPDQTTCGSSVLVAARMLTDPEYAASLVNGPGAVMGPGPSGTAQSRFGQQVLAMHRLTSGFKDGSGGWQIPWPTSLGTQPWALAREMTLQAGERGTRYAVQPILPSRRSGTFHRLASLARAGHPVPLYVGNQWSPRHVVLVLPVRAPESSQVVIYDPARGSSYPIDEADFAAGTLDVAGWRIPWVAVLPSA
jgi:hypothetical protein